MRGMHKDWKRLLKAAEKAGWEITRTRSGGAYRLVNHEGKVTRVHCTPGSRNRGLENKTAELRRMGLPV